jgi:hypothetical protein
MTRGSISREGFADTDGRLAVEATSWQGICEFRGGKRPERLWERFNKVFEAFNRELLGSGNMKTDSRSVSS